VVLYCSEIREYQRFDGRRPFAEWFDGLNAAAAAKVAVSLERLARGNTSNLKGVGGGVLELRIDFGPGYRVYLGRDGEELVILLAGGSKQRQHVDIAVARERWQDYRKRKRNEA
jgi:putative addiction module killer protein